MNMLLLALPDFPSENRIPAMSDVAIEKVRAVETAVLKMPQIDIGTYHVLHGGMYARTIMIPAGALITGALIKVATLLIINGHTKVFLDDETAEISGYHVLAASANRKQAFLALTDTWLTMIFKSDAKTHTQAENEFTDEGDLLMTRKDGAINRITVTGE